MSRMRSLMGGCVEKRNSMKPPDEAKKRCWDSRSAVEPARFAPDIPATFFKAEARPSGLRVNWTAEASARYSRWRETEAWMTLAKKMPPEPMTSTTRPATTIPIVSGAESLSPSEAFAPRRMKI